MEVQKLYDNFENWYNELKEILEKHNKENIYGITVIPEYLGEKVKLDFFENDLNNKINDLWNYTYDCWDLLKISPKDYMRNKFNLEIVIEYEKEDDKYTTFIHIFFKNDLLIID